MRRFEGWRLRTDHETRFSYSAPARASYNEVRQVPQTTAGQTTLEAKIQTSPGASQYAYRDYWGTHVVAFNVDQPHDELVIHGSTLVETQPPVEMPDASWAEIAAGAPRFAEYLAASRYTELGDDLTQVADALRSPTPAATIEAIVGWVHESLEYVRGVTSVHTSAMEAYAARRGVCQDFAHLTLALLRAAGIPARYVSGYFHPNPQASVGEEAKGESHAWIEAWSGAWWGVDPTNQTAIGLRHVLVARGRDYADVAPVKGIYAGNATHEAVVSVNITRTL